MQKKSSINAPCMYQTMYDNIYHLLALLKSFTLFPWIN